MRRRAEDGRADAEDAAVEALTVEAAGAVAGAGPGEALRDALAYVRASHEALHELATEVLSPSSSIGSGGNAT